MQTHRSSGVRGSSPARPHSAPRASAPRGDHGEITLQTHDSCREKEEREGPRGSECEGKRECENGEKIKGEAECDRERAERREGTQEKVCVCMYACVCECVYGCALPVAACD